MELDPVGLGGERRPRRRPFLHSSHRASASGKILPVISILLLVGVFYELYTSGGSFLSNPSSSTTQVVPPNTVQSSTTETLQSYTTSSETTAAQSLSIDPQWVSSFISAVNSYRSKPLNESSTLDQFAAIRFNTLASHYQISHYGFDQDFYSYFAGKSIEASEEYFYPDANPTAYAQEIQSAAPVHWQSLIDSTFTHFGYHLANGPVTEAFQPCSAPAEIVGQVNQTQRFIQYGCRYTVVTATYFVIEISN